MCIRYVYLSYINACIRVPWFMPSWESTAYTHMPVRNNLHGNVYLVSLTNTFHIVPVGVIMINVSSVASSLS